MASHNRSDLKYKSCSHGEGSSNKRRDYALVSPLLMQIESALNIDVNSNKMYNNP